jgi:uncharacterized protein (TIGR03000 family)
MYSVVLMMAMTSGGDVPAFGHHHGCCGGDYSTCCSGYTGYSTCCSGYTGYTTCCSGYTSCCGGDYSCCSGRQRHRLFGRHRHSSCCGGDYTCCSGYTPCCGVYTGYTPCCGGDYVPCCGGAVPAPVIVTEPPEKPVEKPKPEEKPGDHPGEKPAEKPGEKPSDKPPEGIPAKPKPGDGALVPAPATIVVSLPADATLTIDDTATRSTSAVRVFTSPMLPVGQDFHYTLKAEYVRDAKPVVVSKEITVRAGQETRVTLDESTASVASR